MEKNIVVLIDVYNKTGGASLVAVEAGREYRKHFSKVFIVCNDYLKGEELPVDILQLNNVTSIQKFLNENHINFIHYFKSQHLVTSKRLFDKFVKAASNLSSSIKVLTTVCQQPSSAIAFLSPFEIKHSDKIVFIDQTAYNDKYFSFIPSEKKTWMYLSYPQKKIPIDSFAKKEYYNHGDVIMFGRGSTLNKCPFDVITLYDKIKISGKKKFLIIGIPKTDNWLAKKIKNRKDIVSYPILPKKSYAQIASKMDIFLYYLPKDSYSSIDGSLGIVMRMGVPVIVYGPKAPKERIVHGVNGFIANSKEEIIMYAERLAADPALREYIGKNARKSILENIPQRCWVDEHIDIIRELFESKSSKRISCPLSLYIIALFKYIVWLITKILLKIKKV